MPGEPGSEPRNTPGESRGLGRAQGAREARSRESQEYARRTRKSQEYARSRELREPRKSQDYARRATDYARRATEPAQEKARRASESWKSIRPGACQENAR